MVAASAARDRAELTTDRDEEGAAVGGSGGAPGMRTVVAGALVLLLLAAVVVMALGFKKLGDVEDDLDARADVVRVAEQFAVSVNNYDSDSVDDYKSSVSGMLSTKFRTEFDKAMDEIVTQVQEAEMDSTGEVLASGVATIDQDSARVLVVADAAVKTVYDERQRHFRWEVSLVKVDGKWLVDDFTPVA